MQRLTFYQRLEKIPILKTVAHKIAFIAFCGIHLPLILVVLLLFVFKSDIGPVEILLYLSVFTLVSTNITLFYLNKVVDPIRFLSKKLQSYVSGAQWDYTSAEWKDETGQLSRDLDICIETLEKVLHEKNELYRLLSHDLKGMLATLQAGLMMLEMEFSANGKEVSSLKEKIELVERQILSLNSLLYYYRDPEETGNYKEDISSVELYRMTAELVSLYSSALKMDNKKILIEIDDNVKISTEKFLLRHLIFNLVDNAVKYSEKGSTVWITFKDGKFQVSNSKNKQTVFGMNGWKKSTGLGLKIISKTAKDLGFPLVMQNSDEKYLVTLELISGFKRAS